MTHSFTRLTRRTLLRGVGVAVALPMLESVGSTEEQRAVEQAQAPQREAPRRMVAINMGLSFYPPNLIPEQAGRGYKATRYLEPLADLRDDFTIISGTSHPEVDGGHAAYQSWLTAAPHPGAANFSNSISVDQLAAHHIGSQTRFASLALGTGISISANGVKIPGSPYPSHHFRELFLEGRPQEKAQQIERLREGRSVLDTVQQSARRMQRRVSQLDRQKLEQYFTAVREAERQLHKAEEWEHKPKPQVEMKPPVDIREENKVIERAQQLYDIMYLALLTDSTRCITYMIGDSNAVPSLPGVSLGYHNLSHHGQDPEKLAQLAIVEAEHVKTFGKFLRRLKETSEGDSQLLARTSVLLGSHMHSGNHDNRNLPVILAGGSFVHGQHLQFDYENNTPLANLYVSMLQDMGINVDRFASSTGSLAGLERVG